MIGIKLFANFGFGLRLEVFVNTLVILVRTASVCSGSVVARCKVIILECCSKNGTRLSDAVLA